jgi:hypothetical protein
MYSLPEQPEPQPARLRPLAGLRGPAPVTLSPPLADMPLAAPLAEDFLPPNATAPASPPPERPDPGPGWLSDGDQHRDRIRDDMEGLRARATSAASWLQSSRHYQRLLNQDGVVPLTARMTAADLAFLGEAREQILRFTELTARLIDLHQPLDAGGITTDPSSPIRRCRSCMWRWPCPTFSILAEVVGRPDPAY